MSLCKSEFFEIQCGRFTAKSDSFLSTKTVIPQIAGMVFFPLRTHLWIFAHITLKALMYKNKMSDFLARLSLSHSRYRLEWGKDNLMRISCSSGSLQFTNDPAFLSPLKHHIHHYPKHSRQNISQAWSSCSSFFYSVLKYPTLKV